VVSELGFNPCCEDDEGKKANDTYKDGVMIQRVIHEDEVRVGTSYLALTKTNYSNWALLMKVKLK
jgi:hypothetical protein